MTLQTIQALNQLNRDFYERVGVEFSRTRQAPWPGWQQLAPLIAEKASTQKLSILDLGCGNGRFGLFLSQHLQPQQWEYWGLDTNAQLLAEAQQVLTPKTIAHVQETDIIDCLLTQKPLVEGQKFDVVVILGVMHHVPSFDLRRTLIQTCLTLLKPGGIIVFTAWQFLNDENKLVSHERVDIDPQDLEKNDYFLGWGKDPNAIRYCHFITPAEAEKLVEPANITHNFSADSKEGRGNQYYVCLAGAGL